MTDRELTILKAIQHVGRGGPATIAQVIKAVGYPKATTKHVLLELLKKGAVTLHRHDWPQSLKPAERKNMILLAGSYYGAVTVSKRNPQTKGKKALKKTGRALKGAARSLLGAGAQILGAGAEALNPKGQHLPGLPRKAQREYEHILAEARKSGRYGRRKKEVAARTVEKRFAPNPQGMSEKAWKAEENKFRKSIAAYRAKGWSYQQIKDRLWLAYGLTLDKLGPEHATFVDPFHRGGGFTLDLVAPLERRRMAKKNPAIIKAKKVVIKKVVNPRKGRKMVTRSCNPRRKASKKAGPIIASRKRASTKARRRNAGHKDSDHPVEVKHHYRAGPPGYLTPWQRAHHAGQKDLFAHGITPAKRRNATKKRKATKRRNTARKAEDVYVGPTKRVYTRKGKGPNAKRVATGVVLHWSPAHKRYVSIPKKENKTARRRKGRRNPTATEIRKEFAGRAGAGRDLYFPLGTPPGELAKLGKLVLIKTCSGDIAPVAGTAWLCADAGGKLHIGATKPAPLYSGPAGRIGKVKMIEYEETKPHLGYPNPTIWFHKLGEETGHRPTLHADAHGGLYIKGGAYRITRRGIEN